ncbi:hypothetical protein ACQKWADRAFT_329606 [Trichoderma austrokoningii]
MARVANQTRHMDEIFPCRDARNAVFDVCQTGCLLGFLRLLKGIAHGWEADAADVPSDDANSNLSEEKPQTPIHQERQDSYDEKTQWPDEEFYLKALMDHRIRREQSANAAYYIGTITTTYSPHVPASDVSISEEESKEEKALTMRGKRKRIQSDDDVSGGQNQELKTAPGLILHPSTQQTVDTSATHENSTLNNNNVHDRRKLEGPFTIDPTFIAPSSQQPADEDIRKKRSRHNDGNECEPRHGLESSGSHTSLSLHNLQTRKPLQKSPDLKMMAVNDATVEKERSRPLKHHAPRSLSEH